MLGNFIRRNKYTSFGVMKNTIIKVVFKLHYFETDSPREGTPALVNIEYTNN